MNNTLYIIGVGPGDPELLTFKAHTILDSCSVIATPKGSKNGNSTALSIIQQAVELEGKTILELYFPMKKVRMGETPDREVEKGWQEAAQTVLTNLDAGKDVAFPTLGDPAIYSTGYYLYQTIIGLRSDVRVVFVPGISALSSCSATTSTPICLGDDRLAVIPATFCSDKLRETLLDFDTIVLMKVHKVINELKELLADLDLLDSAVLVEKTGMKEEKIYTDLSKLTDPIHYFSTIIVRKHLL
ncbi:MAG: precorrin-2 C(20)-methyltransferase [Desulfocapsa sp.]|nr:precorrin-2 C(20)-methyltransferase [Desulfocapsa sp.]MBN4052858.1 precorrin-2 C(20)-methyltransferase [bacterium AH-315-K15]MBN4063938.1 precorrin-2 C(20)-methyltransferase [bacterium AH-315-I07]